MRSISREDVPVVIADNGVEVRLRDEDGLSVGFVRLPAGADLRSATKGLANDLCPCPHWGYMLKGRVRMHTLDGHQDFAGGEAFYWHPGTPRRRSRILSTLTSRRPTNSGQSLTTSPLALARRRDAKRAASS
jgi:hypothetical protein